MIWRWNLCLDALYNTCTDMWKSCHHWQHEEQTGAAVIPSKYLVPQVLYSFEVVSQTKSGRQTSCLHHYIQHLTWSRFYQLCKGYNVDNVMVTHTGLSAMQRLQCWQCHGHTHRFISYAKVTMLTMSWSHTHVYQLCKGYNVDNVMVTHTYMCIYYKETLM